VTYETIRQWCQKFGLGYARKLKNYTDPWVIPDISTKSLSRFKANDNISGARSIKTGMSLITSCNAGAISRRLNGFSVAYSKGKGANRGG